jgi:hypothetical protein
VIIPEQSTPGHTIVPSLISLLSLCIDLNFVPFRSVVQKKNYILRLFQWRAYISVFILDMTHYYEPGYLSPFDSSTYRGISRRWGPFFYLRSLLSWSLRRMYLLKELRSTLSLPKSRDPKWGSSNGRRLTIPQRTSPGKFLSVPVGLGYPMDYGYEGGRLSLSAYFVRTFWSRCSFQLSKSLRQELKACM